MAPLELYLTVLLINMAASAIPHLMSGHETSSIKTQHDNMMADRVQPGTMPKPSLVDDSAEQDTRMSYSANTALDQARHRTSSLAAFRDAAFDPANRRTGRLETFMAPGPGVPAPKTAEVYEPVTCPTDACDCTKDMDKTPPYWQINCRYKNLKHIPFFDDLPNTYDEITFSMYNNFTSIPYRAFRNLKVKKIDLKENNVGKFEDGAFLGLDTVLETLYLQGNGAVTIPFDKIVNLVSLVNLKLGNFKMDRIYANNKFGIFEKLESLEMYKMKSLTIVDPQAFNDKLPALNELVFNDVGFKDIPIAALRELQSLRKLIIHSSPIARVYAKSFSQSNLQNLVELDLRHNKISLIEPNAFENVCDNLEVLDLAHNLLNQTSLAAFETKKWRNLVQLNLSYNMRIGSFTSSVFRNMPKLEYLNLQDINLQTLSAEMFLGLPSLHTADLSFNQILGIKNAAFRGMPKLRDLRLGYQFYDTPSLSMELDLYPAIFDGVTTSLTDLSLEKTKVRADHFWRMIKVLPSLQNLRASKTGLNIIPDNAFFHNTKLELVDLSANEIIQLSNSAFLGLENSLTSVMLQSNNLSSINKCVFRDFSKLYNLVLSYNKLHCDCKLSWLRDFILQKYEQNYVKYSYTCASPPEFKDRYLFNISELACHGRPEEICNYVTLAPIAETTTSKISRSVLTDTPTSAKPATTKEPASVSLSVGGTTQTSFTLFWTFYGNKEAVGGFSLDYYNVIDNVKHSIPIHPDMNGYEITGLKPEVSYKICVTVEYLSDEDQITTDCKTQQTQSQAPKPAGFKGDNPTNTLAIVVVTAVIVVVIVIAGLYMLVKYKIQKLRELRLTMASPGLGRFDPALGYSCEEESSSCTVPNEYTEMRAAKLAQKHKLYSTKQLQRQLATENVYLERGYSTYHKIKDKKRPKHAEKEGQNVQEDKEYSEVDEQPKTEVALRHSAPSRLDASDLMKAGKCAFSRPLPATPTDHAGPEKSDHNNSKEKEKADHVFMTQASVYENKVKEPLETVEEDQKEKIYDEINGADTVPGT